MIRVAVSWVSSHTCWNRVVVAGEYCHVMFARSFLEKKVVFQLVTGLSHVSLDGFHAPTLRMHALHLVLFVVLPGCAV